MLVFIKGAGDLASGIAVRLFRSGFKIVMSDLPEPTAIRRTVSFSEAIRQGEAWVEDICALKAASAKEALSVISSGRIAVAADPEGKLIASLKPDALVDAIMAKRNTGTSVTDAAIVIGVGPGFTAGIDCHAAVETKRGHTLGRTIYKGSPAQNTGIPGNIGGFTSERLLKAPCDGIFHPLKNIGDLVRKGDAAATVDGREMICGIDGMIRGLLPEGIRVFSGMKSGDIDPRGKDADCRTVSDKALSIGGGVLEALLHKY